MNLLPTCFVGVDPGRYGHGVAALAADGQVLLHEKVDNSEEAITDLMPRIVDLAGERAVHSGLPRPTPAMARCSSVSFWREVRPSAR